MGKQGNAMAMNDEQLGELAAKVARQQIIARGKLAEVGGSVVYPVGHGWEASQLKQDGNVRQVASVGELEAALEDTSVDTLLIPQVAALTLELVKTTLARHSQQKTIFFETASAA